VLVECGGKIAGGVGETERAGPDAGMVSRSAATERSRLEPDQTGKTASRLACAASSRQSYQHGDEIRCGFEMTGLPIR
jgi:hypothetical protein